MHELTATGVTNSTVECVLFSGCFKGYGNKINQPLKEKQQNKYLI